MQEKRIIVADDEPVIADTLATILNLDGFEARAVYSGEAALQAAVTFPPDMLISDVIMGTLNGIETAIMMRTLYPNIKILLFSGHSSSADLLEQASAKGYNFDILAKPIHPKDLLMRLRLGAPPALEVGHTGDALRPSHVPAAELEQH